MKFKDLVILNGCRARWLTMLEGEEYRTLLEIFAKETQKKMTIPGFRSGKAPLEVVAAAYGERFYTDAAAELMPAVYQEAVSSQELAPVSDPVHKLISCDGNALCVMTEVDVYPRVTVEGYKGIRAVRPDDAVSDAEMEEEIRRFRENHKEVTVTDRQSGDDDLVYISVSAESGGKPLEGVFMPQLLQRFDQPDVLPGLREHLAGCRSGDVLQYETVLPAGMMGEGSGEMSVTLFVRVNEIKKRSLKPIDDELFRPAYASRADFLEKRGAELRKVKRLHADEVFEKNLRHALAERVSANIPRSMVDAEVGKLLVNLSAGLKASGGITAFLKENGMTADELKADMEKLALENLKFMLAIDAVAAAEGIGEEDDTAREKKAFSVVLQSAVPVKEAEA